MEQLLAMRGKTGNAGFKKKEEGKEENLLFLKLILANFSLLYFLQK